ncbi:hypothetical protein FHS67_000554 [Aminobacter aminovorans]|uniref:Uncharacterized protein n=1 Tax=Aminobacter aminovorans TaxID=83263 RepID=A0ABR6H1A3_AMIAI|nr:hypothetical protein [Aminobacter aminovorans]
MRIVLGSRLVILSKAPASSNAFTWRNTSACATPKMRAKMRPLGDVHLVCRDNGSLEFAKIGIYLQDLLHCRHEGAITHDTWASRSRNDTMIDLDVGVALSMPALESGTSTLSSGIIAGKATARDVVGHEAEIAGDALDTVIMRTDDIDAVPCPGTDRLKVVRMDEDHLPLAIDAAVAVVEAVDGGVVLRTEGLQREASTALAGALMHRLLRQRPGGEGRLAGLRVPFPMRRGIAQMEAARLAQPPVVADPVEPGGRGRRTPISRRPCPVPWPVRRP